MRRNTKNKVNIQKSKSDKRTELVIGLLIVFTIIGGTLAWQSLSQVILNETASDDDLIYELGGRLHDYYDGSLKEVFVENYSSIGYGEDVYARIRLDEYYEYGEGAGSVLANTDNITVVRGDESNIAEGETPSITKLETWDTYLWGSEAKTETFNEGLEDEYSVSNIRTYRTLAFGGESVYMPTFDKNINSIAPQLNGTYAGPDGDRATDYDRYADYVKYEVGQKSEETQAQYENPDKPEGYLLDTPAVHIAQKTLTATVISMEEWMGETYNSEPGLYWVYDTDGWAYWAQPIEWQTATGLLLNEIKVVDKTIHSEWYYAVNVVAQIATAGDWGDEPADNVTPGTGMYEGGFTENGQALLNKIAGIVTE